MRILNLLASIRLTVVLMALAMVLIFAGTLAQVNQGIWQVMDVYFRSFGVLLGGVVPFPGGFTIGGLLVLNLLAAHVVRFRCTWRGFGMIILHAGLVVLLVGELVTALFAEEGNMTIDEGSHADFIEDIRVAELALIRTEDDEADHIVIPQSLIDRAGAVVAHEALPFDIRVERWMRNSEVMQARPDRSNPATAGFGERWIAENRPQASGVEGAGVNAPSAYIELLRDGETLGVWLVSLHLQPQPIEVDGVAYELALRFKRTYKPYTLHLLEFRHDRFVGTEMARNFSSRIRLVDPTQNEDREVLISMNNPLRYGGATFYQSAYKEGDTGTILQVVRNPGWLLPYIACALVTLGMCMHFAMGLTAFVRKKKDAIRKERPPDPRAKHTFTLIVLTLAGLMLLGQAWPRPPAGDYDLAALGRIPVSADGRVKPLDTIARTSLMMMSGRQTVRIDGGTEPAIRWLADLIGRRDGVLDYQTFRVDHPDVLTLLGRSTDPRQRLSLNDLSPYWDVVMDQAQRAVDIPARRRNHYQRQVIELAMKMDLFGRLSTLETPYVVPPLNGYNKEWESFVRMLPEPLDNPDMHPAVAGFTALMSAYHQRQPVAFNEAVTAHEQLLREILPPESRRARFEVFFNRFAPFYQATILYVAAFLLACGGLLARVSSPDRWAPRLYQASFALLVLTLVVHTFGLVARIWLQGRPPVTNLYSSAVFVGWGCVVLALVLERIYRLGLGSVVAALIGFVTLIIAHNLGGGADTMQMMQAVLDTNFWLATHVIVITIGYSAVFLAGFLGVSYILLGVFTRVLREPDPVGSTANAGRNALHISPSAMAGMVYGVICFALLASFTGTVLGGLWADQSWGRFWGWDPKENGAALIVLITAIILHARWARLIETRGLMILAVSGNIVTSWSWFGTNMLGVGLHSYGFMDSALFWLGAFVFSQCAVMGVGMLSLQHWRSFGDKTVPDR